MNKISDQIKSGAQAFLITEYKYLTMFVLVVFAVLLVLYTVDPPSGDRTDGIRYGGCFLCGALLSASAGWGGMVVATDANVRTTQAADKEGLNAALRVAFTGGAVMGFTVVGLGLLGVSLMFYLVTLGREGVDLIDRLQFAADSLAGFGFGASSIALFARVAGGIFTKAADVGKYHVSLFSFCVFLVILNNKCSFFPFLILCSQVLTWSEKSRWTSPKTILATPLLSLITLVITLVMLLVWVLIFSSPLWAPSSLL
jgi:hypothetical protein